MVIESLAATGDEADDWAMLRGGGTLASSKPKTSAPANPILFDAPGIARQSNQLG
jgi:hypothetical protein